MLFRYSLQNKNTLSKEEEQLQTVEKITSESNKGTGNNLCKLKYIS